MYQITQPAIDMYRQMRRAEREVRRLRTQPGI
jgi:hypothetical protein